MVMARMGGSWSIHNVNVREDVTGRRLRLWKKNILREHSENETLKTDSRIRRYHKRQHQVINQLEEEARLWLEHLKYQCAKWQTSEGRIPRVKIKINCTILKRTLQKCTHIQKTISNLSWAMEAASETLRPPQNVPEWYLPKLYPGPTIQCWHRA